MKEGFDGKSGQRPDGADDASCGRKQLPAGRMHPFAMVRLMCSLFCVTLMEKDGSKRKAVSKAWRRRN